MTAWHLRPVEVGNLTNPAFVGLLIRAAVQGHQKKEGVGMPFALAFLVCPISLHGPTRRMLPRTTLTRMPNWLNENGQVLLGFSERASLLTQTTREGLHYALGAGLLRVGDDGTLENTEIRVRAGIPDSTEAHSIIMAGNFIGRWMFASRLGLAIMPLWGVRP